MERRSQEVRADKPDYEMVLHRGLKEMLLRLRRQLCNLELTIVM